MSIQTWGGCDRRGPQPEAPSLIGPGLTGLPGAPWSVRLAHGPGARPALEIYEADGLVGIIVDSPVAPQVLRGARRATGDGQALGLAWGRLPAAGAAITVAFSRGRLRRTTRPAPVTEIAGWCWLAVAAGRFDTVSVIHRDAGEQLRLRTGSCW